MSTTKRTETREIIKKPGTGRKIVKGIGIISLSLTILFAALFITVAQSNNANLANVGVGLIIILIVIIISALMIRVGRTRRETVTEEITSVEEEPRNINNLNN